MFPDDACLYTIGKSVGEVQMSLQKCVTNSDEWYVSILLSVNTTKSFVMLVGSQQAIHTHWEWESFTELFLSNIIKYGKIDIEIQTSIQSTSLGDFGDHLKKREGTSNTQLN